MKHLIKIKNSTFSVGNSVVIAITRNNLNFQVIKHEGIQIQLLDDSCLSAFTIVPTISSTHFFIKVCNSTKLRVNKLFFDFLVLHSKQAPDQFYTRPIIAQSCVSNFISSVSIQESDLIIEPSAGNGSFIKPLSSIKCDKIFLDIAPENKQIKQADFLE
jgi:hypothetical protein